MILSMMISSSTGKTTIKLWEIHKVPNAFVMQNFYFIFQVTPSPVNKNTFFFSFLPMDFFIARGLSHDIVVEWDAHYGKKNFFCFVFILKLFQGTRNAFLSIYESILINNLHLPSLDGIAVWCIKFTSIGASEKKVLGFCLEIFWINILCATTKKCKGMQNFSSLRLM